MIEAHAVAQGAALDVVLLRGHPGGQAVGRDRRRAEVVGQATGGARRIFLLAVLKQDGALQRQGRCGDHQHLAATTGGDWSSGVFTRQRRGDEAADVNPCTIRTDGHMTGILTSIEAADLRSGARIEL